MASKDLIKRRSKGVQKQHLRRYKSGKVSRVNEGKVSRVNEGIKKNISVSRNNRIVQTSPKASAPQVRGVSLVDKRGLVDKRKMKMDLPRKSLDLAYKDYVSLIPTEIIGFVKGEGMHVPVVFGDLKKLRDEAIKRGDKSFFVLDSELLVDYAKYLIEHLENMGAKDDDIIPLKADDGAKNFVHMPRCFVCQEWVEDKSLMISEKPIHTPVIGCFCKSCFEKFVYAGDGVVIFGVDDDMRVSDFVVMNLGAVKSIFPDFKMNSNFLKHRTMKIPQKTLDILKENVEGASKKNE